MPASDDRADDEPHAEAEAGGVLRPKATVLPDEALVPKQNLVRPVPNRFTHKLVVDEPYRFDPAETRGEPDGVLAAGTPVLLVVAGRERCRVIDPRGLYVEVRRSSMEQLPTSVRVR